MADFTPHSHHPLYYWCLPQMALYIPLVKNTEPPANMTRMKEKLSLSPYAGMSILTMLEKIGLHLWEVMKNIINHCVNFAELLNSTNFLMCARETMAMMDESKKSTVGLEAQERPGLEARKMEILPVSLYNIGISAEMKIMDDPMKKPNMFAGDYVVLADWLEWESDDEEDEGCFDESDDEDEDEGKEEQSSPDKEHEMEWTDEEDSDWSDDEEKDLEASTESTEIWESFLNNDPYNPFCLSCSDGVKTKSSDNMQQQNHTTPGPSEVKTSSSEDVEEHSPKENKKGGTKKVRFSEEVKVHNLVAWSFASREARDGSYWMQLARDRERFKRRVERTEEVLSPCLTSQHRARVWDRLESSATML
ncbi:protein phosphatase 1 regulatory subunit 15A [Astyanax mexicanus]|uniref:Protein phosphatase 1 regulatory subunit 15A n=1 Tax=Astyanax mexicanus TaxID=7994 RepID=A0A8T2LXY1_ASTMX|nr:protein phosphatase 1 regulatory subunit 15A [Astyanax mexicanus]KAG9274216.1 protein phosphatase 1 regulatory subunit 15A-like [Astyanax mexicanus]